MNVKQAAEQFLSHKRVAVTGVSRTPKGHGSNLVYQRLRQRGYQVFAVNPNVDRVETVVLHDLKSIPGGVDAVVIKAPGLRPRKPRSASVPGSASPRCGCTVAPAAGARTRRSRVRPATWHHRHRRRLPLMFDPTADFGHKMMRVIYTMNGHVPKTV